MEQGKTQNSVPSIVAIDCVSENDREGLKMIDLLWDRNEGNVGISKRLLYYLYDELLTKIHLYLKWMKRKTTQFNDTVNPAKQNVNLLVPSPNDDSEISYSFNNSETVCHVDVATIVVLLVNGGHEMALNVR